MSAPRRQTPEGSARARAPGRGRTTVHLRKLLVTVHVLVTLGWLVTAVGMAALSFLALQTADHSLARAALLMTHFLDDEVLVPFALATAYTGIMLGALTPWGFVRHRWIIAKILITVGGLYLGIVWLGSWLDAAVTDLATGGLGPVRPYLVWGWILIAALAVATWLGIAKPGGATRVGRTAARRPPETSTTVYLIALAAPALDWAFSLYGGLMAAVALVCLAHRRWRPRTSKEAGSDA